MSIALRLYCVSCDRVSKSRVERLFPAEPFCATDCLGFPPSRSSPVGLLEASLTGSEGYHLMKMRPLHSRGGEPNSISALFFPQRMTETHPPLDDPRQSQIFYLRETAIRRVVVPLARVLFAPAMRLQVEMRASLPVDGGCIVAANHLGNLDVFALQFAVPRPLFFMAKSELFGNPLAGWLLRNLGAFPVQRSSSDQWAMDHARRVLDAGLVLGMFPEGTRSRGSGLAVARTGAARLALEKGVPIVPVGITGSRGLWRSPLRRTAVRVMLLPPLLPKADDDPLSLTERVMFALAA
jgi:1-acyl-sn-glycerol-3-phosphate acyltransferase